MGERGGICLGLTVNTELDLSAGIAHRTGGGAHVDAGILCSWVGDVEVTIRVRLREGVLPGQGLSSLGVQGTGQNTARVDMLCKQQHRDTKLG